MHIYVYNQYIQFSVSIRNRMCTQHTHTHTHTSERLRQSPQTFLWFACHVAYEEHAEVLSLIIHMLMLWNTLQRFTVWSFICWCCETHCRGFQSDHTYADVIKHTAEVFSPIIHMQMLWNTLQSPQRCLSQSVTELGFTYQQIHYARQEVALILPKE